MSNPALNWALAQRLDPRDKFVLVALANRARPKADAAAGHRHTCNPSIACVAADTGLSERGVQRALTALRMGGLVTIERRGGRHLPASTIPTSGTARRPPSTKTVTAWRPFPTKTVTA